MNKNEIICPYCGYVFRNSWEYDDWSGTLIECQNCDEEFMLEIYVTLEYITYKEGE